MAPLAHFAACGDHSPAVGSASSEAVAQLALSPPVAAATVALGCSPKSFSGGAACSKEAPGVASREEHHTQGLDLGQGHLQFDDYLQLCDDEARRLQKRRACGGCCVMFVAVMALTTLLIWPKDPTWSLTDLSFTKEDINTMIEAFTDPNFSKTLQIPCTAKVELENPNPVGASVGQGTFEVFFNDVKLATVASEAMRVPARGEAVVTIATSVFISPSASKVMMAALVPKFTMTVHVNGSLPAKVFGLIHLTVKVSCSIDLDVLEIVSSPFNIISGHSCTYGV